VSLYDPATADAEHAALRCARALGALLRRIGIGWRLANRLPALTEEERDAICARMRACRVAGSGRRLPERVIRSVIATQAMAGIDARAFFGLPLTWEPGDPIPAAWSRAPGSVRSPTSADYQSAAPAASSPPPSSRTSPASHDRDRAHLSYPGEAHHAAGATDTQDRAERERAFIERWAPTHDIDVCHIHGPWKLGPKMGGLFIATCPACSP
jgi:hypothetical protein